MSEDFELLKSIGQEDRETLALLIQLFHDDTPELIKNIEENVAQKLSIETKKAAHSLKGSCLNMGFEKIGSICKEIEDKAIENDFDTVEALLNKLKEEHLKIDNEIDTLLN